MAGTLIEKFISCGDLDRRYLIHVPESVDHPLPLVIMLHGSGGTAEVAIESTGWREKADKEGFLVVFPDATRTDLSKPAGFLRNPQVWNDGARRGYTSREEVDDVGFIEAMMAEIQSNYVVDKKQIFITGFSNGASMAYRLGAELSHLVAAIAPVSGHLWVNPSKLERPVSLLAISGEDDPLNPLKGGDVHLPWGTTAHRPPIAQSVARWAKLLGCGSEPHTTSKVIGVNTLSYICSHGEVMLYTVEGLGHVWPGGKPVLHERIVGPTNDNLNATDLIWEFFERVTGSKG